jgi:prolyl-tRNA synthetase
MREKMNRNFSEWYNDIIEKAEILDIRYPVKGLYVWFPYGFKVRKYVLDVIRELLDKTGHQEALFPLLIPEHEFAKEAQHIKGFEDEVFWVTHGGREPLNVKLALRPTSETAIYPMFLVWVRSHADLPIKIYQIVNVFRYETKHTRPLIRLREITTFKEAHTVHESMESAEAQIEEAIQIYKNFFDELGVPYSVIRRPDWDKFPGAVYTMAFDTIFPDGRTLQIGTVHNLGQNFAKTFNIKFEDSEGNQQYAYQTCYGISDRVIAALLVTHGDDHGLCIPPKVAPIQCVIIPIWYKNKKDEVDREVVKLKEELKDLRVHVDDRDIRPGSKYFDWEIKGVPLRIELGPKDIEEGKVTVVRRDTMERTTISRENVKESVKRILASITDNLKARAWDEFKKKIYEATSLENARKIIKEGRGVVRLGWCGDEACGKIIEDEIDADFLGIVDEKKDGVCLGCGRTSRNMIQVGRSY